MREVQGVTLIELAIAIGIVAILAAFAAPSFTQFRHQSERAAAVNEFLRGVFLARSESIKRGEVVSMCKSRDGMRCAPDAEWDDGWIVFVNLDRDEPPERDSGEPTIFVNRGWDAGTITSNRVAYSFRPYRQSVVNGTIVFCDPRGSAHARAIIISHTGRPRLSQRDASNRPLRCPSPLRP